MRRPTFEDLENLLLVIALGLVFAGVRDESGGDNLSVGGRDDRNGAAIRGQ